MGRLIFSKQLVLSLLFLLIGFSGFTQIDTTSSMGLGGEPIPTENIDPFEERQMKRNPNVLDGIYERQHTPAKKPIAYHHLREADVMWKKKIWRMLDLTEKINQVFFFPTVPMDNRYNLMDLIIKAVNEQMTVYGTEDDEFIVPLEREELAAALGASTDTTMVEDLETGEMFPKVIQNLVKPEEVTRFIMKEVWFFDKQRSMLEVRIIGLCPIRRYVNEEIEEATGGMGQAKLSNKKVCWVYFPEFRPWLAKNEVFNTKNDAERRTYDEIFFKRRFSSYVLKETNVYDNRRINQYAFGQDALIEGEKVKEFIFKLEHDLWEY